EQSSLPDPWVDVAPDEAPFPSPQPQEREETPLPPPKTHSRRALRGPAPTVRRDPTRTEQMLERINTTDGRGERPEKGLRRFVYSLTNGRVNPGLSKDEQVRHSLIRTLTAPLPSGRVYYIGCFTQKGGLGKTTTATAL